MRTRVPKTLAGLVLLTASVCGCTSFQDYLRNGFKVGPNYGRPPVPVAGQWIDAADVRVRKESPDLAHWWSVFNDPVLNSLIDSAYRQNITLREAGFRVLQARATLAIAIGGLFPQQQDVFGAYTRHVVSKKTANSSFLSQRFFSQWDTGFNLAWEIDFWGRFRRAVESADASLDASVENFDDVLVTLLGDVADAYVQIRTFQAQIELAR